MGNKSRQSSQVPLNGRMPLLTSSMEYTYPMKPHVKAVQN